MPVRHRKHLTRPNERKCPKDLHARLRDPKCRKEMMNTRDPQPEPSPQPKPPGPQPPGPSPTPPTPIPFNPIPPFDPAKPYPFDIPNMGGGGLTWQDKLAISGAATIPAEVGVSAALISRGVAARAAAARAAAARATEARQADLGGEAAEAEIDEAETALVQGPARAATTAGEGTEMEEVAGTRAVQAAGTQAERQATLASARAAETVVPKTEGTPIGAGGDVELQDFGAARGLEPTEVGAGVPKAGPTGQVSGGLLKGTGQIGGEGAEETGAKSLVKVGTTGGEAGEEGTTETTALLGAKAGQAGAQAGIEVGTEGAIEGAAEGTALITAESGGLALGPEAIPAVAAMVAVTALVSFGPEIVQGIASIWGDHDDWYHTLKHASRYKGDDWSNTEAAILNQAAGIKDKDQRQKAFDWLNSLDKAHSHGLNIVKWEDEATDTTNITAQKGTKQLAIAIAKYQRNPDAFKGQDPRVLAIEGLNPIMAYGKNGAVLNPNTGFYEPVTQYSQVKDIDQTMKLTAAALLKETQDNPKDTRNISLAKMQEVVNKTYMDDGLLPGHDKYVKNPNPYLSEMGNTQSNVDNSVLSTQAGIMKTAGSSQTVQDYINKGAIIPATGAVIQTTTKSSSAPTGAATAPTTGSQSNQKPASAPTTQQPATTTTQQGTATAPEAQVAQKTQNK